MEGSPICFYISYARHADTATMDKGKLTQRWCGASALSECLWDVSSFISKRLLFLDAQRSLATTCGWRFDEIIGPKWWNHHWLHSGNMDYTFGILRTLPWATDKCFELAHRDDCVNCVREHKLYNSSFHLQCRDAITSDWNMRDETHRTYKWSQNKMRSSYRGSSN